MGDCFGENQDHAPTSVTPDVETRNRMAETGKRGIITQENKINMPHVEEQLLKLEACGQENEQEYSWLPVDWNRNH